MEHSPVCTIFCEIKQPLTYRHHSSMFSDHNGIKLQVNIIKYSNTRTQSYNLWNKEKASREVKREFWLKENKNTTYQNVCNAAKLVLERNLGSKCF